MVHVVAVLLVLSAINFISGESRETVQILEVFNGGQWGDWAEVEFCPEHEFAIGYQMRVEATVLFGNDDTALNTVKLICARGHNVSEITISSGEGFWGDWTSSLTCNYYPDTLFYITSFDLQVEKPQGSGDDTAANWIKFKCSQIIHKPPNEGEEVIHEDEVLDKHPGQGDFGTWNGWSHKCPQGSAVCGIATKVEPQQGGGDDTTLNDVRLYCCEVFDETFEALLGFG